MRTITEIYNEMLVEKNNHAALDGLNSSSNMAVWKLLFYVVAVAVWTFEQILGISTTKMTVAIKAQKIHSTSWHTEMAKRFQLGYALPHGEIEYAVIDEDAQIIKYCATSKTAGGLRVKIATLSGDTLVPVLPTELTAFESYMAKISPDLLFFTNTVADDLKLEYTIYYDPLIFNSAGERLDGTNNTPVQNAIEVYLKTLDFSNTQFVPTFLTDELQKIEGVYIPVLNAAQSKYALLPYADIPAVGMIPNAGYLRVADLTLNFEAWQV